MRRRREETLNIINYEDSVEEWKWARRDLNPGPLAREANVLAARPRALHGWFLGIFNFYLVRLALH